MVRAMQGLTADAPVLKTMAGISARGRKLRNPCTHIVLSWPEGTEAPPKQENAVGRRRRAGQPRPRPPPLRRLRPPSDTACPHVHVAVSRVDIETGRAVNLDQGAHAQAQPVGSNNTSATTAGVVVPGRVERREARAARRSLERRCRKAGRLPRSGPLDRRAPALAAGEAGPRPAVLTHRFDARPARAVDATGRTAARRGAAVSGPPKRSGSNAGGANGEPARPRRPEAHAAAGPAPSPSQCVGPQAARRRPASASSCDAATAPHAPWPASPPARPRPDRRRHHRHVCLQRRGAVRRQAQRAGAQADRQQAARVVGPGRTSPSSDSSTTTACRRDTRGSARTRSW